MDAEEIEPDTEGKEVWEGYLDVLRERRPKGNAEADTPGGAEAAEIRPDLMMIHSRKFYCCITKKWQPVEDIVFDKNVRDTNERTIYYHTRNNGAVAFSTQIAKRFDEYRRCFDSSMYFREDAIGR